MTTARILLGLFMAGPLAFGAGLVLDGTRFAAPGIGVVWNAPTNHWPTNLWIYKVVAQEFSPAAISNLMAAGGFTMKDRRTRIDGQPPFSDRRLLYFTNQERTRHLGIFPPMGWLYYRDEKAPVMGKEKAHGVPSESEALKLALEWLDKLGIDRSQLVTKDDSLEIYAVRDMQDRGKQDRATGQYTKEVVSRGISFIRRIDGVDFTGLGTDGGFHIAFANDGKVADLEFVWRNLKPHKSCKVATPAEIVERIKRGEAKMAPMTAVTLNRAKRLTINKARPYYLGEGGDTPQEFTYPFASLECTLEADEGSTVPIVLKCSILAEE